MLTLLTLRQAAVHTILLNDLWSCYKIPHVNKNKQTTKKWRYPCYLGTTNSFSGFSFRVYIIFHHTSAHSTPWLVATIVAALAGRDDSSNTLSLLVVLTSECCTSVPTRQTTPCCHNCHTTETQVSNG